MSQIVDLAFPVSSAATMPADHGYALYGAISRMVPHLHELAGIGIHPIAGTQVGNRQLQINERSRLIIRCSADQIPSVIALSGKSLGLAEVRLRVGVPQVRALVPATALRSRLVTIKLPVASASDIDEANFLEAVRQQLGDLGISQQATAALGKRRTLNVKGKEVVGYEMIIEGLSVKESLDLQRQGVGGRRKMGCGIFVAFKSVEPEGHG
ncbi:MAG: type I-MYXAN CRISPR-associated protein Cas6/Cmx6 [Planctomycetales bacterium]|nr:type I-MYXAN CRISPR-associated protein Cas6/Cmx6 [Planctomycetales bacterium]